MSDIHKEQLLIAKAYLESEGYTVIRPKPKPKFGEIYKPDGGGRSFVVTEVSTLYVYGVYQGDSKVCAIPYTMFMKELSPLDN